MFVVGPGGCSAGVDHGGGPPPEDVYIYIYIYIYIHIYIYIYIYIYTHRERERERTALEFLSPGLGLDFVASSSWPVRSADVRLLSEGLS